MFHLKTNMADPNKIVRLPLFTVPNYKISIIVSILFLSCPLFTCISGIRLAREDEQGRPIKEKWKHLTALLPLV